MRVMFYIPESSPTIGAVVSLHTIRLMLDEGGIETRLWTPEHRAILNFKPDVFFGYGGLPDDVARFKFAQANRALTVFTLRNANYTDAAGGELLRGMDGILSCSKFIADLYRGQLGIDSAVLPLPIHSSVIAMGAGGHGKYFTMVNPSPEKGGRFIGQLSDHLHHIRPDICIRVYETRGTRRNVCDDGSISYFSSTTNIPEIYTHSRATLIPSLWREPAGRVAAESILNGIPCITSGKGGLREVCNGSGIHIPIPVSDYFSPAPNFVIEEWAAAIIHLNDDDAFHQEHSRRSLEASSMYDYAAVSHQYCDFFSSITSHASQGATTHA